MLGEIPPDRRWSAVVAAVAHHAFATLSNAEWSQLLEPNGVLVDLKGIVPRELGRCGCE